MKLILPSRTSSLARLNRVLAGPDYADTRYFILVDENTYTHCLATLVSHVECLQEAEFLEVPSGEECKDIAIAQQLWETLLDSNADRSTVLINLGGGCVSDLGGFVAAGYKRGIRHINIPTTLVGMIDASIGGKTAVNLGGSKNQVGFFHNPEIICIEPTFLNTLPKEEVTNGLFEMLKTFLIGDAAQFSTLCDMLSNGAAAITDEMIATCVRIKTAIVKKDPKDHDIRHILNLGHTFGHAIEAFGNNNGRHPIGHGVSVGIGTACALYLSVKKLGFPEEQFNNYLKTAASLIDLPHYSLKDTEEILSHMRQDKKNVDDEIRCVLLQEIGAPVIDIAIDENELRTALLKYADSIGDIP